MGIRYREHDKSYVRAARGIPTHTRSARLLYGCSQQLFSGAIFLNALRTAPIVNSISYGMTESHVDVYLGNGYIERSDVEFQKLALQYVLLPRARSGHGCGWLTLRRAGV